MSLVQPQILPPTLTQKAVNDVPLTRKLLEQALVDLSERLYRSFQQQVRLVVHGGAVMVLYRSFNHRESTNDVNYIHRSFVSEHRALGFPHAEHKFRSCIADTARKFDLGADWMNDHADVALPWALDKQGRTYDPVFWAAVRPESATRQTIFSARGLALVAVPWPWAMALKLVRYEKQDPADCAAVLRLGLVQRGIRWTYRGVETWITERCWPMGFTDYLPAQRQQLHMHIQDALNRAFPPESPRLGGTGGVAVDEQRDAAGFLIADPTTPRLSHSPALIPL